MSGLEERIAGLLHVHSAVPHGNWHVRCSYPCSWKYGTPEEHAAHLAAVVVAELALTPQWAVRYTDNNEIRAWVCGHDVLFESRDEAMSRAHFLRHIDETPERSAQAVSRLVTPWVKEQP